MKSLKELQEQYPDLNPEIVNEIYFEGYGKAQYDLKVLPNLTLVQLENAVEDGEYHGCNL